MQPRTPQELERVFDAYIAAVQDGTRVAGQLEQLAVERHLRQVRDADLRKIRFNRKRGIWRVCWWCEHNLCFSKGEHAGEPFILQGWEAFLFGSIGGWETLVDDRWIRAVRDAYVTMARGNAKSEGGAALGLCVLMTALGAAHPVTAKAAPIAGAECYTAAMTRDQAAISWRAAYYMAKKSPKLRKRLDLPKQPTAGGRYNIAFPETGGFFRAVAAKDENLDGLGPDFALVDELHAHKSGGVYDVLGSGMVKRKEPLRLGITTRGHLDDAVLDEIEREHIGILRNVYEDDRSFAFMCELDEEDDPWDESVWTKPNPNLGVSVYVDGLRADSVRAKQSPPRKHEFLCKGMNRRSAGASSWMPPEVWDSCNGAVDLAALEGRQCWLAFDLSSTRDTTALSATWAPSAGVFPSYVWGFVPQDSINDPEIRGPRERELLARWIDHPVPGHKSMMTATPGSAINYEFLWQRILWLNDRYPIVGVAFDRWHSSSLSNNCEQIGLERIDFGQGYESMGPAMETGEILLRHGRVAHGGQELMRWAFSNLAVETSPSGFMKPTKKKKNLRMDAMVAWLMSQREAFVSVEAGSQIFMGGDDDDEPEAEHEGQQETA